MLPVYFLSLGQYGDVILTLPGTKVSTVVGSLVLLPGSTASLLVPGTIKYIMLVFERTINETTSNPY